ncbi:uncharacterized protein N7483_011196 [Penicillium malachiteum]|uniref:uncharacterized protein n=1 Tax=Penicillium malachiteum TaxID=1324776 RepID=UPI00254879C3|nr:uncharacterized protein N7483_011196 [Penicillium malachiteum]KAJ5714015.1 hypothetical protein N7483_011196 [Penicillium malachiteum]
MEWKAPSKRAFFEALERLDQSDDSDDGYDFLKTVAPLRPSTISNSTDVDFSSCPKTSLPGTLARANTDPKLFSDKRLRSIKDRAVELNHPRRTESSATSEVRGVQRSNTTGSMPATKSGAPASKKRKSNSNNTKVVPEDQQIFKELVFFFFPNNDVSPARRLRIQRAREYGAQWALSLSEEVTHVIVDKGLRYQDLLKHIKLEIIPEGIALVNETYPSDCIRFRSMLSSSYERFRVDGVPEIAEKANPTTCAELEPETPASLPVKKSKRELEQSQESSQKSTVENDLVAPSAAPAQEIDQSATSRERDALDDLIDESRAITDKQSDDESTASSDSERHRKIPELPKEKRTKSWAMSFACMQKPDSDAPRNNPNKRTIEILQQMSDYYERMADHWRSFSYRRAINALRRQTEKIVTRKQARSIRGIGERLADKIEEIVLTDRLRQLDNTGSTPEDRIVQEFIGIFGVGLIQAYKWLAQGFRSLEDLLTNAQLSPNQRIGVEHYHDFMQRIPRKEVEAHGVIVQKAVHSIDPDMQVIIAGSYRRGALDSGDIDVLITKPDTSLDHIRSLMNDQVIPKLFADGFLQVGLATSRQDDHDGSKWHGASTLPGSTIRRRIDLLFVPGEEFRAALIYFTGNDIFNRSMRLLAHKKGLCLNQRGLYANVLRNAQRVKVNPGRLLESRDERRIFALLGVPWRPPEQRIC